MHTEEASDKAARPLPPHEQKGHTIRKASAACTRAGFAPGGERPPPRTREIQPDDEAIHLMKSLKATTQHRDEHTHVFHSPFRATAVGATNPEASETRHRATSTTNALKAMVIDVKFGSRRD